MSRERPAAPKSEALVRCNGIDHFESLMAQRLGSPICQPSHYVWDTRFGAERPQQAIEDAARSISLGSSYSMVDSNEQ